MVKKTINHDLINFSDIPVLKCDNTGAVKLSKNPEFHKRTKHIDTRYFWIREKQIDGDLKIEHIAGENQVADIMTKSMPKPRFQRLRLLLGLRNIEA